MAEWNKILREDWYSRQEPDEMVIEFTTFLRKRGGDERVLDLGCGGGRHQLYMSKQGFEVHGIDTSETGLELARKRLQRQKLEAYLAKCDMKKLPYVDSCFHAVICLHAVYHQKLAGIQATVCEIRRVLRKDGYLLMNFLSKRTYSYRKGVAVEKDTFMEEEGVEKGVLHHFVDREEIERLLSNFKIVDLKLKEGRVDGKLRSRWIAIAMV
jgi:ubiquinone/menaquinone biosynthesis C-methylase UbiE